MQHNVHISLGMLVTDVVAYKIFWEVSGKTLHDIIDVHSTTIFTFDPSFVTIYQGLHSHLLSLWNFNFFLTTFWSNLCWIFHLYLWRVIEKWVSLAVQTNWLLKPFSTKPNFRKSPNYCMPEAELSGTSNWLLCFKFAFSSTLVTFSKLNFQLGFSQCSKIVSGLQEDKEKSSRVVAWEFCRLFWSFLRFSDFYWT
jgi:hypothetical protein